MDPGEADGGAMKAFAIAGANLRRLLRDKTGAFFVFVFPFLIILALGAAFGSAFMPKLGVVGGSDGLGQDLRERLEATDGVGVQTFADGGRCGPRWSGARSRAAS